ncbi:MAG: helix-turn-helix transcriptional regulator [Chitinophagales bacterium]|nr:helix-turn-helix transcriptional regulator [Chitinophagales bacterium]MBP8753041.1 helix-turn-helix transcriptional regulator [Chitinophagales bacterium]MBP9189033.1 helix-turn-helix transcriptional regulator [Chitinophagales bacterium]MBP9703520.1 helix-turn-helix transcriptional regulator [Chitinophagales bacterium]
MPSYPNVKLINAPNEAEVKLDYNSYRRTVIILRAVNHKLRQHIIRLLDDNKEMTVTEVYIKMRMEQSVASQHLAFLRKAGVVSTNRKGKYIFYSLNYDRLKEIAQMTEELID